MSISPHELMNWWKPPLLEQLTARSSNLSSWESSALKSPIRFQGLSNALSIVVRLSQNFARCPGMGGPYKQVSCLVRIPDSSMMIQLIIFSLDKIIFKFTRSFHISTSPPALPLEGTASEQSKPKDVDRLFISTTLLHFVSDRKTKSDLWEEISLRRCRIAIGLHKPRKFQAMSIMMNSGASLGLPPQLSSKYFVMNSSLFQLAHVEYSVPIFLHELSTDRK